MDLEVAKKALETGIAFVRNCGLRVVELRRGYVKCAVPFEGNGNHEFLKPAKSDVTIEIALDDERIAAIAAEADAKGKAEFTLDGELTTADGTVVATSHGVYQLRVVA